MIDYTASLAYSLLSPSVQSPQTYQHDSHQQTCSLNVYRPVAINDD